MDPLKEVPSAGHCQEKCRDTKGCKVFTFQKKLKICWLKHSIGVQKANLDLTSGPAVCPGAIGEYRYLVTASSSDTTKGLPKDSPYRWSNQPLFGCGQCRTGCCNAGGPPLPPRRTP